MAASAAMSTWRTRLPIVATLPTVSSPVSKVMLRRSGPTTAGRRTLVMAAHPAPAVRRACRGRCCIPFIALYPFALHRNSCRSIAVVAVYPVPVLVDGRPRLDGRSPLPACDALDDAWLRGSLLFLERAV